MGLLDLFKKKQSSSHYRLDSVDFKNLAAEPPLPPPELDTHMSFSQLQNYDASQGPQASPSQALGRAPNDRAPNDFGAEIPLPPSQMQQMQGAQIRPPQMQDQPRQQQLPSQPLSSESSLGFPDLESTPLPNDLGRDSVRRELREPIQMPVNIRAESSPAADEKKEISMTKFELPDFDEAEFEQAKKAEFEPPTRKEFGLPEEERARIDLPEPTMALESRREAYIEVKKYLGAKKTMDSIISMTSKVEQMFDKHADTTKEKNEKYAELSGSLNALQEKMMHIDEKLFG